MDRERAPESARGVAIGKYHLFASLGRGGMADVYLAVARGPVGFNKLTVIKRLRSDLSADPTFASMLLDEARLAARLNHPNVVHTYEVGETDGAYYIAMEYLEGQPLVRVARASSRDGLAFEPPICARIVAEALAGLHYAHELRDYDGAPLSIIHRDVSPHNIFITYDGAVKLMDFGIAKAASSSSQTEIGVLKGKVAYMAPEQARAETIDRRADVFSMGVVLWEMLTRHRLFHAGTTGATLHRLLLEPVPRVSEHLKTIDPQLDAIVARALAKEPEARFQTALEMRNALEAYIATSGVTVRQEEIGLRTSEMFEETHQRVHRQIQLHMADLNRASTSSEMMALNAAALRNLDGPLTPSGRQLLMLAPREASGSSSDVVSLATPSSVPAPPTEPGRRRGAMWMASLAMFAVLAVSGAFVFRPPGAAAVRGANDPRPSSGLLPTAAPSGTPSAAVQGASTVLVPPVTALGTGSSSPAPDVPRLASSAVAIPRHSVPLVPRPTPASAAASATGMADAGTGYLTLDTYPWTRVSENGHVLGTTPLVHVPLASGTHILTLENTEQGLKQSYTVTLKADEAVSRRLGLK